MNLSDEPDNLIDPKLSKADREKKTNWSVVNCSTSANYFHVLRRQLRREYRKPLIVASPKKLLRFKEASSDLEDFGAGTKFREVISDEGKLDPKKVKRIVFCSGQVYYDLH